MLLLDTSTIIHIINDRPPQARQHFEDACQRDDDLLLSSIVLFELEFGIAKSARPDGNRRVLQKFLTRLPEIADFTSADATHAGDIRQQLEAIGRPIGPFDTLIAGQARARNAVLVTSNLSEFSRVPGLQTVSWTSG